METSVVRSTTSRQSVPAEPLRWIDEAPLVGPEPLDAPALAAYVGRVRLPIAGPYRPWARLYRLPDHRHVWVVRLWDQDRPVRRITSTAVLLEFARRNQLPGIGRRVRALDRRGRGGA